MNEQLLVAIPFYLWILPPLTSTGEYSLLHSFLASVVDYIIGHSEGLRIVLRPNVVVVPSPFSRAQLHRSSPDQEKEVSEASSIHIDLGFSAPYLDLPLLRSGIPSKSLTPRIQWDFTPGKSFTLPPLIKTLECSCEL